MPDNYKPVPVESARRISEEYAKSIVIILAWDPEHALLHTTTFGRTPQDKTWAAQGGDLANAALGGMQSLKTEFEDYRLTQAQELLEALVLIRNRVLLMKSGPLRTMALQDANETIKKAEAYITPRPDKPHS